jgi:hypothetical protein
MEGPGFRALHLFSTLAVLIALIASSACRAPGSDDEPEGGLSRDLAATPAADGSEEALSEAAPRARSKDARSSDAADGEAEDGPRATGSAGSSSSGPFDELGSTPDGRGDNTTGTAPGYGDLRRVEIATDGSNARVTVEVGATIPKRLSDGEVVGIGVDLYRRNIDLEGTHQLFVDGGSEGWFAYLYTRDRFVRYPGTLTVSGKSLVFIVPWSALEDLQRGWFSAFADWSRRGDVKNDIAEDRAPDRLTASYG